MYLPPSQLSAALSDTVPPAMDLDTYRYSISWKLYLRLQRKGWFRCSSIRRSRMMLRTLSDRTTVTRHQRSSAKFQGNAGKNRPSSFRMYFKANVRPVSLRSTMRTLPNAPLPTTRSRRK